MANILALVNRGGFDDVERTHGAIAPGSIVPLDRYLSAHAMLRALHGGGALHLVTVRPDERLLLLAVLRNPTFDGQKWIAETNTTPVRDLTDLLPELRSQTGKSLTAAPGKLAMSLQTPRVLDDASAVLLAGAEAPSSGGAYHAAVVATLGGTGGTSTKKAPPTPTTLREDAIDWRVALDIAVWRTLGEGPRRAAQAAVIAALAPEPFSPGTVSCGPDRLASPSCSMRRGSPAAGTPPPPGS